MQDIPKEIVKGSLKFMILQTLSEKEEYGYEIAQSIRNKSENLLKAGEGSLYPALHKLESEELIFAKWDDNYTPKRKYYFITPKGRKYLNEQKESWSKFIDIMSNYINQYAA